MSLPIDPQAYNRLKTKGFLTIAKQAPTDLLPSGGYTITVARWNQEDKTADIPLTGTVTLAELQALLTDATARRNNINAMIADVTALG